MPGARVGVVIVGLEASFLTLEGGRGRESDPDPHALSGTLIGINTLNNPRNLRGESQSGCALLITFSIYGGKQHAAKHMTLII